MLKLFVDTTAWCGIYDKDDHYHQPAKSFLKKISSQPFRLITSDYIFTETITLIRARVNHAKAVVFGKWFLEAKSVELIEVTKELRNSAWEMFVKYNDKTFSFVDCTSFVIMQELGLKQAFAFDQHFIQMGFETLPYLLGEGRRH